MLFERFVDALEQAAGRHGLEAWSLHGRHAARVSVGIKDRVVGGAHAPMGRTELWGGRYRFVWSDGTLSQGALERSQLEGSIDDVLKFARTTAFEDPDAAVVHGPADYPDVVLHDPTASTWAAGDTDWLARRLQSVRQCVDAAGIATWSGSFSAGEGHGWLRTSRGAIGEGRGTSVGWHVTLEGIAGDGYGGRLPDSEAAFTRRLDRLVETAHRLGGDAATLEAGSHRVLLHPGIVDRFALATLLHHFEGSTLSHGEGRFGIDDFRDGRRVLHESVSLRHDPLRPLGGGSYRFTAEGIPADRRTLIDAGRVITPLLDLKFARRLQMEPSPDIYDAEALDFVAGTPCDRAEADGADTPTVHVLSVLGIHTQDVSSGDFSLSAPQALVFRQGRCLGRQRGTISGNLFALLQDERTHTVSFEDEPVPGLLVHCRFDPA